MPRSASAQFGAADFVLPPAQIAAELARIAGHPYVRGAQPEEETEAHGAESQFASIYRWVKRATGVDFPQYKPSTLRRRILRRMVLHKMETMGSLLEAPGNRPARSRRAVSRPADQRDIFFPRSGDFQVPQERHVIPDILKQRHG